MPQHRYITPLIYPIFSTDVGTLVVGLDLQTVVDKTTRGDKDFTLSILVEVFADGEILSEQVEEIEVRDGILAEPIFVRRFQGEGLGFAQISIRADRPVFTALSVSVGYGLLSRPGYGTLNVLHDEKYASPAVIQQIREIGRFCLLHPASLWDSKRDAGNSFLLVNPYGKALMTRLSSDTGRRERRRIAPRSAVMLELEPLLEDGRHGTVMLTGTNRLPVWDVRHAISEPHRIFNIDHLEVFRGAFTHQYSDLRVFARASVRKALREMHLRII